MSATTLTIAGFSASDPVPGFFGETKTGQGQQSASSIPRVVLLCGIMGAGAALANTVYPINSSQDADNYFKAGFQVARQCYAALQGSGGSAQIFAMGIPAAGGATAAVSYINLGGSYTTSGNLTVRIAGVSIQITVNATDTLATVGTNLANAINQANVGRLPVTATSAQLGSTGTY